MATAVENRTPRECSVKTPLLFRQASILDQEQYLYNMLMGKADEAITNGHVHIAKMAAQAACKANPRSQDAWNLMAEVEQVKKKEHPTPPPPPLPPDVYDRRYPRTAQQCTAQLSITLVPSRGGGLLCLGFADAAPSCSLMMTSLMSLMTSLMPLMTSCI